MSNSENNQVSEHGNRIMYGMQPNQILGEDHLFTFDQIKDAYHNAGADNEAEALLEHLNEDGLPQVLQDCGEYYVLVAKAETSVGHRLLNKAIYEGNDEDEPEDLTLISPEVESSDEYHSPRPKMEQLVGIFLDDLPNERALRQELELLKHDAPLTMKLLGSLTAFQERAYDIDSWKPAPF